MKKEMKATYNEKENNLYKMIKKYQESAGMSESDFVKLASIQLIISFTDDGKLTINEFANGIKAMKRTNALWNFCGFKTNLENPMIDFLNHKEIELKKEVKKE